MILALVVVILLLGALAAVSYGLIVYNGLVQLRNESRRAWSNIDILLKQRQEEVPNLVEVCRGYAAHEQQVLREVAEARARVDGAEGVAQIAGADLLLRQALGGLFAVVEGYPELKADEQFRALQERITQLEDSIADRRELYNESATAHNIRREQLPDALVARWLGIQSIVLWRS